jgi:hypothetical protein
VTSEGGGRMTIPSGKPSRNSTGRRRESRAGRKWVVSLFVLAGAIVVLVYAYRRNTRADGTDPTAPLSPAGTSAPDLTNAGGASQEDAVPAETTASYPARWNGLAPLAAPEDSLLRGILEGYEKTATIVAVTASVESQMDSLAEAFHRELGLPSENRSEAPPSPAEGRQGRTPAAVPSPFELVAGMERTFSELVKEGRGTEALFYVVDMGYYSSTKALLEAGADPNATDAIGRTPRTIARQRGFKEIERLLAGFQS